MSELLTVQQVSERLKVTPLTVRRWLTAKKLAGVSLGDRAGWRIDERDLETFMQSRGKGLDTNETVPQEQYVGFRIPITEEMVESGAIRLRKGTVTSDGAEWSKESSHALVRAILSDVFEE